MFCVCAYFQCASERSACASLVSHPPSPSRTLHSTLQVVPCDPPARCQGGRYAVCEAGYQGFLCGECAAGYFIDGKLCTECSAPTVGILLVIVDVAIMLTVFVAVFTLPIKWLGIAIFLLTCIQLIRLIGKMNVGGLPPVFQTFYRVLSVTTGEGVREQGCDGSDTSQFFAVYQSFLIVFFSAFILIIILMPVVRDDASFVVFVVWVCGCMCVFGCVCVCWDGLCHPTNSNPPFPPFFDSLDLPLA